MSKISIITITYNASSVLERTLQSLAEQTFSAFEYIIIDGASKDNTLDLVRNYKQLNPVIVSEKDKGIYDAMNKGIAKATGEYICFLNAGDAFDNENSLSEILEKGYGYDLIYGNSQIVLPDGTKTPWHKPTPLADRLNARSFMQGMVVCHQAMIVRRSIAPVYDLSIKVAADLDWCIRVMKQVKTKCHTGSNIILFLGGGFSSANQKQAVRERFHIAKKYFGLIPALLAQGQAFVYWFKKKALS